MKQTFVVEVYYLILHNLAQGLKCGASSKDQTHCTLHTHSNNSLLLEMKTLTIT